MKIRDIDVPIYGYNIKILFIDEPDDAQIVKDILLEFNCSLSDVDYTISRIMNDEVNGGTLYRSRDDKKFIVVALRSESIFHEFNTIGHEKRHIEDWIVEYSNIKDPEASAYLAGFLSEKMFRYE